MNEVRTINDSALKSLAIDVLLGLQKERELRMADRDCCKLLAANQWLHDAQSCLRYNQCDRAYKLWKDNYDHLNELLASTCICQADETSYELAKRERQKWSSLLDEGLMDLLKMLAPLLVKLEQGD